MNRMFYYLIITFVFLGGAFLASLDPRLMNWPYFIPLLIVGLVAVVLLKRSVHRAASHSEALNSDKTLLGNSLKNIIQNLEKLEGDKKNLPTYEVRFDIDRLFREDLTNFAEARKSMIHLFSLQIYADIMSDFAAGERYINRVWSASADGYVDEVNEYLTRALDQFHHAAQKFSAQSG